MVRASYVTVRPDLPRYPTWHGAPYHGTSPWSLPWGASGANQLHPKPAIRHWVVLMGTEGGDAIVMEPNHHSPARPEKVAYDRISLAALNAAYLAGGRIAVVPTRSVA
jgi:hypothetical protein